MQFENGRVSFAYSRFLGYDKGEGKCSPPVVNGEQAEVVKDIYRWFMTGLTPYMIAKQLTGKGIKTPTGRDKWTRETVESILINEKYMGDAILQKSFTVDFLEHKTKENTGEVPKYHVKNSHEAIIPPDEWKTVQNEMARRKALGRHYSGKNTLSGRIVCGCCGGIYGPKVWASNTKYRKTVWQCNSKYTGAEKCTAPYVTEDAVKATFTDAFNGLFDMRKELLENTALIKEHLTNTADIDNRMDSLLKTMDDISELTDSLINQNARAAGSQEEYQKQYDLYSERFGRAKEEYEELKSAKEEKERKAADISLFEAEFRKSECRLTEFDARLWHTLLEKATVNTSGTVSFLFTDGTVIEKPCKPGKT